LAAFSGDAEKHAMAPDYSQSRGHWRKPRPFVGSTLSIDSKRQLTPAQAAVQPLIMELARDSCPAFANVRR